MKLTKLPRSFYLRPTLTIAKEVLGKFIVRRLRGKLLIGKIVEVEAYLGDQDPASHAYRGKTKRTDVMFREGGHLYVYFTYGMHFCANIVTEEKGIGHAILIRGVEPIEGVEAMMKNRRRNIARPNVSKRRDGRGIMEKCPPEAESIDTFKNLTNGPAKFCQAFGIARRQNGTDLVGNDIFLVEGEAASKTQIGISTRIGIRNAMEKKWRFYIKRNAFVSKK
jgi:DNA-3-methyladenine glycosylase